MTPVGLTRRGFYAAGAVVMGALASAKVRGANDRVRMGVGVGGMGTGHVSSLVKRADADNVLVTAVCDVYQRRVTRARKICNGDGYLDYRTRMTAKSTSTSTVRLRPPTK
jgi:hypothetical protein